jgi:starch phosphorylase
MVLVDFDGYYRVQMEIDALYCDSEVWTKKSILNVARIGKFSSDRTILEYNRDIWHAEPVPIERNQVEQQKSGPAAAKADAAPRQARK